MLNSELGVKKGHRFVLFSAVLKIDYILNLISCIWASSKPISDSKQSPQNSNQIHDFRSFSEYLCIQDSMFPKNASTLENGSEEMDNGGSIFKFSSHKSEFKDEEENGRWI